jgi:O-antigen/teichoic acid export membrane protein
MLVIPQISQYFYVGLINTMTVLVPTYVEKGKNQDADRIKNIVLNISTFTSVLSFFCVLLYVLVRYYQSGVVNFHIAFAASLIFFWQFQKFFVTIYAAENNYKTISWVELLYSVSATIAQVTLTYYFSAYGFWWGFWVAGTLLGVYMGKDYLTRHRIQFVKFQYCEAKKILSLGLAMEISSVTYTPFIILAKIILAQIAGPLEVGYFVLSVMVIARMAMIPGAIARVLLPRISQLQAETENNGNSFQVYKVAQYYTLGLTLLAVVAGWMLLPTVIGVLLPSYAIGVPAAYVALLAGIPYCLIDNANNYLLALQYKRLYLLFLSLGVLFQLCGFGVLYFWGNLSAYTVSVLLIFIFSLYAFLVNIKVIQIHRRQVFKSVLL